MKSNYHIKLLYFQLVIGCLFQAAIAVNGQAQSGNHEPLVISPAFDPNVYVPDFENLDQVDSICGAPDAPLGNYMGHNIRNLGVRPGETNGSILIGNLRKDTRSLTSVETGPNFNLHNLKKQVEARVNINFTHIGHFHSSQFVDLYDEETRRIYWADNEGNYDENRYTRLASRLIGKNGYYFESNPLIAKLSSDTVDDIVIAIELDNGWPFQADTTFIAIFKGGEALAKKGEVVVEDTAFYFAPLLKQMAFTSGDYRGTGRKDVIAFDPSGNIFFYKNEGPEKFSLEDFTHAIKVDTLSARWQNKHQTGWGHFFAMRALAKPDWDQSQDLIIGINTDDDRNGSIGFIRTGPDFGSKRFTIDDVAYTIPSPYKYDFRFANMIFPGDLYDCGDMTGTGNRVLLASVNTAGSLSDKLNFFYVTGKALDDKVDMYYLMEQAGVGFGDTLTANDDNKEDFLFAVPSFGEGGTIQLIKGTDHIPVRLNPLFSVKELASDSKKLSVYPNPCKSSVTVSYDFENNDAKPVEAKLYDMLGRVVYQTSWNKLGSVESYRLSLPYLTPGVYTLKLSSGEKVISTRLNLI